jgi:transposase InsO family protein
MPWREVSVMEARREFVRLALQEGANRRELCRRFGISPPVAYKWLARWQAGDTGLTDRSRRPHDSPGRSGSATEAAVLAVRDAHPAWGARKIASWLARRGVTPPAVSTVHAILRRHGRIAPEAADAGRAYGRFEKPAPNQLWQMDFKGWVSLAAGGRCHPLTIVDDHSRFAACLQACGDQQGRTVQAHLEASFRRYGLPDAIFVDNGSPWGDSGGQRWTRLGVWLLKLGVDLIYSRPYHPQSRGKNERFHRTLAAEVFALQRFADLAAAQRAFDRWREIYNFERPHEALGQAPPASRYRPSSRTMPARPPSVDYDTGEIVRTVPASKDYISFQGRRWKVPQAFRGERVAIRPLDADGRYGVFFASRRIASIDLTARDPVSDVSEQASAMSPG